MACNDLLKTCVLVYSINSVSKKNIWKTINKSIINVYQLTGSNNYCQTKALKLQIWSLCYNITCQKKKNTSHFKSDDDSLTIAYYTTNYFIQFLIFNKSTSKCIPEARSVCSLHVLKTEVMYCVIINPLTKLHICLHFCLRESISTCAFFGYVIIDFFVYW